VQTYYTLLKVSAASDAATIRNAYLALMRRYHPDTFAGDKDYAERLSRALNEAYAVLSNPARRAVYDEKLGADPARIFRSKRRTSPAARPRGRSPQRPRKPAPRKLAISAAFSKAEKKGRVNIRQMAPAAIASLLLLGALYSWPVGMEADAVLDPSSQDKGAAYAFADPLSARPAMVDNLACCEDGFNEVAPLSETDSFMVASAPEELNVDPAVEDAERSNLVALRARQVVPAGGGIAEALPPPSPSARMAAVAPPSPPGLIVRERPAATVASPSAAPSAPAEAVSARAVTPRASAPKAVNMSQQARAELAAEVNRQLQSCANRQASPGLGANRIVTSVNLRLNRDGSFARRPTVLRQNGLDDENRHLAGRVAELAIAEFANCSSVKGLPEELYDVPSGWRSVTFNYRFP
jgi:hypothetical protein